jgi:transcriptional regulator with XRE-family HTH domain
MGVPKKGSKGEMIGKKIRAIREAKGISRRWLCNLLGGIYSYDALTKLELGKVKDPPINVLTKIAEVLEIPLEEILKEDERVMLANDLLKDPDITVLMYQAKDLSPRDRRILLKVLRILKEENDSKRQGK